MNKILVSQHELSLCLKYLKDVVTNGNKGRNTHPVLQNVLIQGGEGSASFTVVGIGRYLDESLTATIPSCSDGELKALVNFATLSLIASSQKKDCAVEISVSEDEGGIPGLDVNSAFIRSENLEDYPVLHENKGKREQTFSILSTDLHKGITHTALVASRNPSRGVITGVFLEFLSSSLTMTATDGNCMISLKVGQSVDSQVDLEEEDASFVLPVPVLNGVSKVIGTKGANPVVVLSRFSNRALQFEYGEGHCKFRYLFKEVPGEYPKYPQLFPQSFSKGLRVSQGGILDSVTRATRVIREGNRVIKFQFDGGGVVLKGHGADENLFNEGLDVLELRVEPEDHIAFNCTYLQDVLKLKSLKGKEVVLEFNSPTTPAIIRVDGDDSLRALIMPVQLRNWASPSVDPAKISS